MITFESRVLSEYRIKRAKVDRLAKSILTHRDPNGEEAKNSSNFLNVLINEIDNFYKEHNIILSNNGNRPHPRSRLPETKKWNENVEKFYEKNPRKRPRK